MKPTSHSGRLDRFLPRTAVRRVGEKLTITGEARGKEDNVSVFPLENHADIAA
jgi:hypothetical protein